MGRLRARCKLGFDLNTQVHHCRDEPGIVGAAIYGEIFIDQRSLRSHPNKAVDVVVCQSSCIDSGSRVLASSTSVLPSKTNRVAIVLSPSASFPFPLAG
jgi:hypothetical protein